MKVDETWVHRRSPGVDYPQGRVAGGDLLFRPNRNDSVPVDGYGAFRMLGALRVHGNDVSVANQ